MTAGCKNPHAIAEFAKSLNHGQRRNLRCRHPVLLSDYQSIVQAAEELAGFLMTSPRCPESLRRR